MDIDNLTVSTDDLYWEDPETMQLYRVRCPLLADDSITKEGECLAEGIPSEKVHRIGPFVVCTSSSAHVGPFKNAVDFLVPDGTPVLAAVSGTVVDIVENNDEWGPEEEYVNRLNYITIKSDDGVLTQYCHLSKGSVTAQGIRLWDRIEAGRQIAITGKTGYTDRDHLHFIVFRLVQWDPRNPHGFRSIKVQFE